MRSILLAFMLILVWRPASGQAIEGAWKVVEILIDSGPERGRHVADVQPGLLILTNRHYSMMFVHGFRPRPLFGDSVTNDERVRAFRAFTANAGTYVVRDSTITFTPWVAKVPNTMAGDQYASAIRVRGDTLFLIPGGGRFARQLMKWVRAEP